MKKTYFKLSVFLITINIILSCSSENNSNNDIPPNTSLAEIYSFEDTNSITINSITISAKIYNDGGAAIIKKGIVWDINPNPTINLTSKTDEGKGSTDFTSNLTNLLSGTTYYYRAYATNSVGTSYSTELSFKTCALATLTTNTILNITKNSATAVGKVISYGFYHSKEPILNRGVVWSTSQNPTIELVTKTIGIAGIDAAGEPTETFSCELTGLIQNTTYYARTYLTTKMGTAYGEQQSFSTTTLGIGDNYQGGIIGYLFRSGDSGYVQGQLHGLIVAPKDLVDAKWFDNKDYFYTISGMTSSSIGSGNANTILITNKFSNMYPDYRTIAATLCYDLVVNGYSDWYLPSAFELYYIAKNKTPLMNFSTKFDYWSSTGPGIGEGYGAVGVNIWTTNQMTYTNPGSTNHIRAVRTF